MKWITKMFKKVYLWKIDLSFKTAFKYSIDGNMKL